MTATELTELEKTLKPCPFCGTQPVIEVNAYDNEFISLYCKNNECKLTVEVYVKGTPQDAARIWDERKGT